MSLFRQTALDALSNPEKLDQPLRLLRARQWLLLLSLGGFCLSILTWSVLGRLPVRVSGRGVLVRQDSLKLVQSESTGRLQELAVEVVDSAFQGWTAHLGPSYERDSCQLTLHQAEELALLIHQGVVVALFPHLAAINHHNPIGIADRA